MQSAQPTSTAHAATFFFSSRRRHTRCSRDWSSDVCSSDLSITVRSGELVVIEGPSGSGKSTLLNVLGLLEDADAGEICFGEHCVSALGRVAKGRERGRWLGFVFQSFLLVPTLTALDNVLLGARYTTG